MKIAYIVEPRRVIGGGVRAAINLSKSMNNLYGETTIVFGVYKGALADKDVHIQEVSTLKPISFGYWRSLGKFINSYKPDIVHCLGLYTALLSIIYKKITHKKFSIVCTVHRVTMNLRFRKSLKYIIGFIAKNLNYTTFLTSYQQEHYFKNIGFRPNKYAIIPNVIYIQQASNIEIQQTRNKLTTALNTDFLTSYVGRIIPSKNLEDFIRIIALANRQGVNIGGVLVGGYDTAYYLSLIHI